MKCWASHSKVDYKVNYGAAGREDKFPAVMWGYLKVHSSGYTSL
jgi:hypothetical protein